MHTRTISLGLTLITGLLTGTVGCGLEPVGGGEDEGEVQALPPEVQVAFNQSCATSPGCHATGSSLVVLEAPESIQILESQSASGGGSFVTLGDIGGSYIAQKILGGPNISGGTMPPAPQSDNDQLNKAIIIGWIAGVPLEEDTTGDGDGDATGDGDGDDSTGGTAETCYIESLPTMPSYEADIWPILEARCALSGCHLDINPTMPDAVTSYDNLVDIAASGSALSYIEANNPDGSYLWHKVVGTQASDSAMGGGSTMPIGGRLCGIEFQALYAWISTGAML